MGTKAHEYLTSNFERVTSGIPITVSIDEVFSEHYLDRMDRGIGGEGEGEREEKKGQKARLKPYKPACMNNGCNEH